MSVHKYLSSATVARLGKAGRLPPFGSIITPEALARSKPENVARLERFVETTVPQTVGPSQIQGLERARKDRAVRTANEPQQFRALEGALKEG